MIFTIGYSNRSISEFGYEIERRGVTQIVDVRSSPWSRNPYFTRDRLARWAERSGRMYRWDGAVLGGRSVFAPDSQPYREALERLIASAKGEHVAILCAEGEPEHCHRCYDVGAGLLALYEVPTVNIRRDGSDEDVRATMKRIPTERIHQSLHHIACRPGMELMRNTQKSADFGF